MRGEAWLRASWVGEVFFRRPYQLCSSLPAEEVLGRLDLELDPESRTQFGLSRMRRARPLAIYRGRVQGASVRMSCFASGVFNSSRIVFEGHVTREDAGSRLEGTIGPQRSVSSFLTLWFGIILGCLLISAAVLVYEVVAAVALGALLWVGAFAGMFVLALVGSKAATNAAVAEWRGMDEWLRDILEVRPDAAGLRT